MRFFSKITVDRLNDLLTLFSKTGIDFLEIILPYIDVENSEVIENLFKIERRLRKFVFYDSPKTDYKHDITLVTELYYIKEHIHSEKCCGKINGKDFNSNIQLFSESQKYNTCLNRKIGIDTTGNIKNCPSMEKSFGNISSISLKEIISNENFSRLWTINKDEIKVCQDCEFRYVCTDCRAYIENKEDIYSKPLKCGYNPYTCEWSEWSENKLKTVDDI